jgi:hypothetical protein
LFFSLCSLFSTVLLKNKTKHYFRFENLLMQCTRNAYRKEVSLYEKVCVLNCTVQFRVEKIRFKLKDLKVRKRRSSGKIIDYTVNSVAEPDHFYAAPVQILMQLWLLPYYTTSQLSENKRKLTLRLGQLCPLNFVLLKRLYNVYRKSKQRLQPVAFLIIHLFSTLS